MHVAAHVREENIRDMVSRRANDALSSRERESSGRYRALCTTHLSFATSVVEFHRHHKRILLAELDVGID